MATSDGTIRTKNTELIIRREEVLAKINEKGTAAMNAIGLEAVGQIVNTMQNGYSKPIWKTGDLQRDVNYEIDGTTVNVGNSLDYALYVHEGTCKMNGRPYIKDGIENGKARLQEVFEAYFKEL